MNEVIFIGTGGGRYTMITQMRATGGFRLNLDGFNIHVDPGPGAVIRSRLMDLPRNLDAILVSHHHTDHVTDLPPMIESMTNGGKKERGYLIGTNFVLRKFLTKYHLRMPGKVIELRAGEKAELNENGLEIYGTSSNHADGETIGFKFITENQKISYISDTGLFDEMIQDHIDSDVLIVNVGLPDKIQSKTYLCTEDATKLIEEVKPDVALITHFGVRMIKADPEKEAKRIQRNTGVKTIAAEDKLRIKLEEIGKQESLEKFK